MPEPEQIVIPPIDPSTAAAPHAAPFNPNGKLPDGPQPSKKVTSDEVEDREADEIRELRHPKADRTERSDHDRPGPYSSPEPIEALFAQLRADLARQEKMLMLTATSVIFLSLLLAYTVKKGGLIADAA